MLCVFKISVKKGLQLKIELNTIHVWRAHLDVTKTQLDQLCQFLSSDELSRGHQLINPLHQKYYLASHAILRVVLSQYLSVEPKKLQFQYTKQGKPFLISLINPQRIQFNMSHSKAIALIAIRREHEVGIDVEFVQPKVHALDIAKRYFSDDEYQQLIALPESEQLMGFYRAWTRKEAFVKAIGLGLSFPLKHFTVDLVSQERSSLLQVQDDNNSFCKDNEQWRIQPLKINDHFCAAVAYCGEIAQIEYFNWDYC